MEDTKLQLLAPLPSTTSHICTQFSICFLHPSIFVTKIMNMYFCKEIWVSYSSMELLCPAHLGLDGNITVCSE